jgi:hypothetical protein
MIDELGRVLIGRLALGHRLHGHSEGAHLCAKIAARAAHAEMDFELSALGEAQVAIQIF